MSQLAPTTLVHYQPWVYTWIPQGIAYAVGSDAVFGESTSTQPVEEEANPQAGQLAPSWGSQLWGSLVLMPSTIDYGFLLANRDDNVYLWNTSLTVTSTLTAVSQEVPGVIALHPILPYGIPPLGELESQVQASTTGPPEVSGGITYVTSTGTGVLTLTGIRTVVFAHPVATDMVEILAWETDIVPLYDGGEEREAVQDAPHRSLKISSFGLDDAARSWIEALLVGGHQRAHIVPFWPESQDCGPVNGGATEITVDTRYSQYAKYAIIMKDYRNAEVVEIMDIQPDKLTLVRPVANNYDAPVVAPALVCLIADNPSIEDFFHAGRTSVEFRETTPTNVIPPGYPQYRDDDVNTVPIYMTGSSRARTASRDREIIDFGGIISILSGSDWSRVNLSEARLVVDSPQEAWTLRQWFFQRQGRYVPVWIDSDTDDITMVTPSFGPETITFEIKNNQYVAMLSGNPNYKDLFFLHKNGTTYRRRVVGASNLDEDLDSITLDAPFEISGVASDFTRIGFCTLYRLASDRIEMTWRGVGRGETTLGMVGINGD